MAAAQAETARLNRDNDAKIAANQAETERMKRESDAALTAAQAQAARVKQETDAKLAASQAEAARIAQENAAQRAVAQSALDRAANEKQQLEKDKADLRAQLLSQFNVILQTRDTARGLIVNMSDVIFDSAKSSLLPGAREKLSKVAGIVSGHPGLKLEVEGHTDNVGQDDYNQQLSEKRGEAVRAYLVGQGMAQSSVSSKGLGESQPVASNETAAGRQQNRRVEIVISGEIIGKEIGAPLANR
jgi:outer membrane protein OmpA-like peptidoglycan-associated protein